MRIAVLSVLFACVVVPVSGSASASAESQSLLVQDRPLNSSVEIAMLVATETKVEPAKPEPEAVPKVHIVQENESLTAIAKQYETTWNRLYDKNLHIANPDVLNVGEKVTIPLEGEKLVSRPLPEPPVVVEQPRAQSQPATRQVARSSNVKVKQPRPAAVTYRGSSSGNTYTAGYCTWYVKNRRADLPNNLGNANTWASRAAAQGLATGRTPRAGAVGQQGMHVVYVESVNGNGTVTISEMNYRGLYVVSTRTVPASNFIYIY